MTDCPHPNLSASWSYLRYGCRCPRCVAGMAAIRNASAKRTGGNLRVGARADQKRAWDNAHPNRTR